MRNFKYKIFALLLLGGLVVFSSVQQSKLDKMRNRLGINDASDIKDKSPSVIFTTVALGSFRGFIANLLFLRSNRLQEERRYYEVHQLAKWIRNLQPKFTGAIAFMAWNMAYNISVTFDTPEERWVWVRKGMELYRDAIRNHSGDPELYREYGWIYQHKMGMNLDDANRFYKREWAIMMVHLLGEDPDLQKIAYVTRNPKILHSKLVEMGFEDFIKLLELRKNTLPVPPGNHDATAYERLAFTVTNSEDKKLPETVAKFIKDDKYKEEIKKFIIQCELHRYDFETLAYLLNDFIDFEKVFNTAGNEWNFERLEERFRELGRMPVEFRKALDMQAGLSAGVKDEIESVIDSFLRDRWAWKEFIIDVRKLLKINKKYGNIDWRIPEAHALYWAKIGLEKDPNNVPCRRMVTQSMKDIVDRGKLLYYSSETHQNIDWTFNVDLIPSACEVIERHINELPEDKTKTFYTGYENFLKDCIHALYATNKIKEAKEYAEKLMGMFPANTDYKNLQKIMTKELAEDIKSMNEDMARNHLQGFVQRALDYHILYESPERAQYYWRQAKIIFDKFHEKTKTRKGRQGWTKPFYDMALRVAEAFKKIYPQTSAKVDYFFNSMTVNEPRKLIRPDLENEEE